ncbi:acyltransferase [Marinomonas gallaica]|uniref:acyltransferase n=1 Tax=Marinomonas gallaica TaxID=1806667 RepID=UPI003A921A70
MFKKIVKFNAKLYEFSRLVYCFFFKIKYRTPNISLSTKVERPTYISKDVSIGKFSYVNKGSYICSNVICGDYVMFGPNVTIAGNDHCFNKAGIPMIFSGRQQNVETKIADDVWIGASVCIKAGVTIGKGAIVGMGSVVTKDIEPYAIYCGNPARFIRFRFTENEIINHQEGLINQNFSRNYC